MSRRPTAPSRTASPRPRTRSPGRARPMTGGSAAIPESPAASLRRHRPEPPSRQPRPPSSQPIPSTRSRAAESVASADAIGIRDIGMRKDPRPVGGGSVERPVSGWSAGDLARLQARGAYVDALRRLADNHAHALHVRVEAPLGTTVRVRHVVSERGTLVADLTYGSHRNSSERTQVRTIRPGEPGQLDKVIRCPHPDANPPHPGHIPLAGIARGRTRAAY